MDVLHFSVPYALLLVGLAAVYVLYQRFLHPLSEYPGPWLACLSNTWKAYHIYRLDLHEVLLDAHRRYGPIVRIGPNDLHFWNAAAIAPIYKAGRQMGKTEFYDAFTAFRPNLFGGRDEDVHACRRRQLSHGLSQASVAKMESIIEIQIDVLVKKLQVLADEGQVFDLKHVLSAYVLDILGEVAFGRSFDAQAAEVVPEVSAINDHLLLSCVIGSLPCQNLLKHIVRWSPVPWVRRLMKSRNKLKQTCAGRVDGRTTGSPDTRGDILQHLLDATDPQTGAKLTDAEIKSEAFAMLVAGSHTTSGSLGFLFWHILHNDQVRSKMEQEIKETLGGLPENTIAYPISGLESSLGYTRACVQESFRITPVFTMCLWRRVLNPAGTIIDGHLIPCKTNVAISNYVLHHNPAIWGPDTENFVPDRFYTPERKDIQSSLIPFSVGHRACIGRNLALTNMWKTLTTLLVQFDFQPLCQDHHVRVESSGIGEIRGPFLCKVTRKV